MTSLSVPRASPSVSALHSLADRLFETRRLSLDLAKPLSAEDMVVQAMDDLVLRDLHSREIPA
jgi:hypothetical protein